VTRMNIATLDLGTLLVGFLRVSGFMFTTPVFGSKLVPTMIRVWLALLVAVVLMPALRTAGELPVITSGAFMIVAVREVLLGLLIGFVSSFFIYGVEFAGHVVGLQMGFGTSTLFDPLTEAEVSVLGTFKGMLAVTLFLVTNGHHEVLSTFVSSYRMIPAGGSGLAAAGIGGMVAATASIFSVAVRVSIPILSALLMAEVGLALLAKTVPQMNIFVVGFPVKVMLGLAVFGFSVPYISMVIIKAIHATNFDLGMILSALGGGR
jgi:flagellar biosynthetic protein FliR